MADIVVAGHLCLDILPQMQHLAPSALASPGKLFEVGPLTFATGGAVSNVGLALHQLGLDVQLMAALGDDLVAQTVRAILRRYGVDDSAIGTRANQNTSYSVVLSASGQDRIFLHYAGNNATFSACDVDFEQVKGARVFHLGYPPILPALTVDDGAPLAALYQQVKALGVVTSLDMSYPDAQGASGRVNWRAVLTRTLPFVDVFVPSIEETLFMLRREDYEAWGGAFEQHLTRDYLRALADEILGMGAAVAGFKLGALGLYLKASDSAERLAALARLPIDLNDWCGFEAYHPAYQVQVVGTTGAGDCCYAGLIASLVRGLSPHDALDMAAAVGACNVEAADATSGIRSFEATQARLRAGWPMHQAAF